jgi:hypothetical protein
MNSLSRSMRRPVTNGVLAPVREFKIVRRRPVNVSAPGVSSITTRSC